MRRLMLVIVVAGLVHRLALALWYRGRLETLISNGHEGLLFQYASAEALREHLGTSLLYLQQTPPIPTLLLGLALRATDTWPGLALVLLGLQALLSCASAVLLFRLLCLFGPHRGLYAAVSIVFLASLDLVLIEYFALGQTFYEVLSMTFVTLAALAFVHTWRGGGARWAAVLGLSVAGAALSRATFSYLFAVPVALLLLRRPLPVRALAVTVATALPLQIAWSAKNARLYGSFELGTSSWSGTNVATGLAKAGFGGNLLHFILDHPDDYPPWFVRMTREIGIVGWWTDYAEYVPDEIRRGDREIELTYPQQMKLNGLRQRTVSALYLAAFRRLVLAEPGIVVDKLAASYPLFWQPIRNQTWTPLDLFYVETVIERPFRLDEVALAFARGELPETTRIQLASKRTPADPEAGFVGLATLPLLLWGAGLVCVHALPLVLLWILWRRGRSGARWELWLFPAVTVAYTALLVNLSEHGENMRYRLPVEPMVWLLTVQSLESAAGALRASSKR